MPNVQSLVMIYNVVCTIRENPINYVFSTPYFRSYNQSSPHSLWCPTANSSSRSRNAIVALHMCISIQSVVLPRRWRTVTTAVPNVRTAATCPLLTRQALLSYASSWNLIHYKYNSYSGTYLNLPRCVLVLIKVLPKWLLV